MTARRSTIDRAGQQREIIAALRKAGDAHVARRLERCMEVRLGRRRGGGWPEVCRSPGCGWCGPTLARRWWRGIERWVAEQDAPASRIVLPLPPRSCGRLRARAAVLRRALRDLRDRTARRCWRWRGVAIAGMVGGDGAAVVLVRHPCIAREEVARVFGRRWSGSAVGEVGAASPRWEFASEDAAELALLHRGVEPLRLLVLAQRGAEASAGQRGAAHGSAEPFEPMPIAL